MQANAGAKAVARGFLAGLIAGAVVSGLGLAAASMLSDIPGAASPQATALEVPAGSEFDLSREDKEAELPAAGTTPEPAAAPRVEAPEPDDLSPLETADTGPAAQPEAGGAEGALETPPEGDPAGGVEVDSDSPIEPGPQAAAPSAPEGEGEPAISTDPAQPAMPEIEESGAAFPETPAAGDSASGVTLPASDPPAPDGPGAPQDEIAALVAPEEPDADASGTIGDLAPEVETGRLPSVAGDDTAAADTAAVGDLPALERYAVAFENPEGKPLMAIVLIDTGDSPVGPEALESFPYPLSFAVEAARPDAAAAMARYRAAGFEVLAMADLPEGASARDAEVAMQSYIEAVPEAVAVMEGTGSGLQASREAAGQLAPILSESGHGLVLFAEGLDTARKLIARQGVPAATVFRDFDAKGQDATVIRRFLDQAAFKAGVEEGGVIMVGRLRPDTVSALLLWGLQDRAGSVALAPVSALLRAQ